MFISKAYAAASDAAGEAVTTLPDAPTAGEALGWNIGLILVIVVLFYFLLIRPQQKRFQEHNQMLNSLKKGDKVVTGGGLVGKVHKIESESNEVVIDLGGGVKVTALRSMIHAKDSPMLHSTANDAKEDKKEDRKEEKKDDKKKN